VSFRPVLGIALTPLFPKPTVALMHTRRRVTVALAAALAMPVRVLAQPRAQPHRIGFLSSETLSDPAQAKRLEVLRASLRDLGYIEGRNIVIETRWAEGRYERLSDLAKQLVALKPEAIVVSGTKALLAARDATTSIPLVMGSSGDPIALGVTTNIARPTLNVTGWTFFGADIAAKLIELLKETVPRAVKLAYLINPAEASYALETIQRTAASLHLGLATYEVRAPADFNGAFVEVAATRCDCLLVQSGSMFVPNAGTIAELALRNRLPSASAIYDYAESGGLITYGPDRLEGYRRAAFYVDKIIRGAKVADLPIEQASTFEFVINMSTAKSLGLAIPQALQARARLI
jgi:putative ABC transport system substrate-binding protein